MRPPRGCAATAQVLLQRLLGVHRHRRHARVHDRGPSKRSGPASNAGARLPLSSISQTSTRRPCDAASTASAAATWSCRRRPCRSRRAGGGRAGALGSPAEADRPIGRRPGPLRRRRPWPQGPRCRGPSSVSQRSTAPAKAELMAPFRRHDRVIGQLDEQLASDLGDADTDVHESLLGDLGRRAGAARRSSTRDGSGVGASSTSICSAIRGSTSPPRCPDRPR